MQWFARGATKLKYGLECIILTFNIIILNYWFFKYFLDLNHLLKESGYKLVILLRLGIKVDAIMQLAQSNLRLHLQRLFTMDLALHFYYLLIVHGRYIINSLVAFSFQQNFLCQLLIMHIVQILVLFLEIVKQIEKQIDIIVQIHGLILIKKEVKLQTCCIYQATMFCGLQ